MADGDVFAEIDAVLLLHAVEDAAVLNVGVRADANFMDVAAEDGVHPDGGVFAQDDVADDLGGGVDVAGGGDFWGDVFEGADHWFIG